MINLLLLGLMAISISNISFGQALSNETCNKIATNIVNGYYNDRFRFYNMFPVLIERKGDSNPVKFEDMTKILWIIKGKTDNEPPIFLLYTKLTKNSINETEGYFLDFKLDNKYAPLVIEMKNNIDFKRITDKNKIYKQLYHDSDSDADSYEGIPLEPDFLAALQNARYHGKKGKAYLTKNSIDTTIDTISDKIKELTPFSQVD